MIQLGFYGAAETVTGSKYLLEADGHRVLIDCGLFQGLKELRLKNWAALPFSPSAVSAILLTHAHIDHSGYLPRFAAQGYRGPIHCTSATSDLLEILLFDAAKNQESDAEYFNRKGISKHHPAKPLFDERDVIQALRLLRPIQRNTWLQADGPIWARFCDAGHLLGSCWIEVEVRSQSPPLRIVFSGDVGRYDAPLYFDPAPPVPCDYLICESTYGNREHSPDRVEDRLTEVVQASIRRGGVMLIAAFAVGRAQQLVYLLQLLIAQGKIPELPIFIDSPMAVDATAVYKQHSGEHDFAEWKAASVGDKLFGRNVRLARTQAESKRINDVEGPAIIISSSGMMEGGRILFHLKQRLPNERNTIVLGGFMAEGTRGRRLQEGAKFLRIHGREFPVRAQLASLPELSGHAGRSELLRWLSQLPKPRRTFLTHGEKESAMSLAEALRAQHGWDVHVPKLEEVCELT